MFANTKSIFFLVSKSKTFQEYFKKSVSVPINIKYPILARDPIVPSVPSVPGVQVCLNPIVAIFIKAISLIDNLEFGISCKTYTG